MTTITIDRNGGWQMYTNTIPAGGKVLGTVTRGGVDTGALVLIEKTRLYVQINASAARNLPQAAVRALVEGVDDGKRPQGRPIGWRKPADERKDETVRARVSAEQAQEWELIGGAEWLRETLDKAAKRRARTA